MATVADSRQCNMYTVVQQCVILIIMVVGGHPYWTILFEIETWNTIVGMDVNPN